MRTVSFSPSRIRRTLNRDFVCHTINTEGDSSAGRSNAHSPTDKSGVCSEGVANQNVQLLFLTPQSKIFHTASGFRGPDSLSQELRFARTLFRKIQAEPDSAESIVRAEHKQIRAPLPSQSQTRSSRRGGCMGNSRGRSFQYDYTFAQKYPMLPMTDFEKNPRLLVGRGSSFFATGSAIGGRIGG